MRIFLVRTSAFAIGLAAFSAVAATYYVDFDDGNDANAGTVPSAAFQRAPGDPAARDRAAAVRLQPGDRVIFKGGVAYRGTIGVSASGAADAPIVFDGNTEGTFGQGPAVLDGSEPVADWRRCADAAEAGGHPQWRKLWTAALPSARGRTAFSAGLVQGEQLLYVAQWPNPEDPFYDCNRSTFLRNPQQLTPTSLRDPRLADIGGALVGGYALVETENNFMAYPRITGWDAATSTLTFSRSERRPVGAFSIANALSDVVLDRAGEYVLVETPDAEGRQRVFVWPWDDADLSRTPVYVNRLERAFSVGESGVRHVTIQGFKIQNYRQAIQGRRVRGLVIRRNEITRIRDHGDASAINFVDATDHTVSENHIHHCQRANAIQTRIGTNVRYLNNRVEMVGRSPLRFYNIQRSRMVGNVVLDCRGIHSNPYTIYVTCSDILVANNVAHRSNIGMTLNDTQRVYVIQNIFTSPGGATVGLWEGAMTRDHVFLHNFIGDSGEAFFVGHREATGLVVKNNIMTGVSGFPLDETSNVTHNLYIAERPRLNEGEFRVANLDDVLLNPAGRDYRPRPTGPAVDMGADVSRFYPRELFPDFDFDRDFAGNPRNYGAAPDIGPFEAAYPPGALAGRAPIPTGAAALPKRPIDGYRPLVGAAPIVIRALDFTGEGGGKVQTMEPERQGRNSFVRGWNDNGHWLEYRVAAPQASAYTMTVRYTSQFPAPRRVEANGRAVAGLDAYEFPATGNWETFRSVALPTPVPLNAGENRIRLTSLGGRGLNLDELRFRPAGGGEELIVDAGAFAAEGGAERRVEIVPAPRHGLFRMWGGAGHWLEWTVENARAGTYRVEVRYATLASSPRSVQVNGEPAPGLESFTLDLTKGWRHCEEAALPAPVVLREGRNVIRFTSLGGSGLNFDEIRLVPVERAE